MTRPPGEPPTSPYVVYESQDFSHHWIRLTVTFGPDYVLTSCTADRDPACRWKNILFGLGPNGPDDTAIAIRNIPPGHGTDVPIAQLNALGFNTVLDIIKFGQVTAS